MGNLKDLGGESVNDESVNEKSMYGESVKEDNISNAIAIVGISCKFPQSENTQQYWNNIKDGHECMETLSEDELEQAGVDPSVFRQNNYIKRCPSITDIDKFDADFFKISPKEASYMDPQQRLILEKAWEALEDAGYDFDHLNKKAAVFASTSASSYFMDNLLKNKNFVEEAGGIKAVLHGLDKDHIATKIAYKLNLTGPAITVQSACSSSMVGTILACQSLLTYQCDIALAGGVTVNVPQRTGYLYEKGSVVSQDGYCRPFDENASGTVFGSGVGCIVLKRLEDAIQNNDHIYCIIKGFSIGNDGNDKVGYTAPSIKGQMDVISEALEFAEVDPSTISYVEAHGTATIMGDPIEVEAISKVYKQYTNQKKYCSIGSVKANIGHLNVASGIAGIIKAALVIENKVIPPLINLRQESNKINFKDTPFYINKQWIEYTGDSPMRVAVSSFGIGGTNGHMILEEYCKEQYQKRLKDRYLIPLSGRDHEDLKQSCNNLLYYLKSNPLHDISDIERTLQCRKGFLIRKAFIVQNLQELLQEMEQFAEDNFNEEKKEWIPLEVTLSCGIHYDRHMIRKIYEDYPLFKKHMDYFQDILVSIYGMDFNRLLHRDEINEEQDNIINLIVSSVIVKAWRELGLVVDVVFENCVYDIITSSRNMMDIKNMISEYLNISASGKNNSLHAYRLENKNLCELFLSTVAKWWETGNQVNWDKWIDTKRQDIISLPTYPFKRNTYWIYSTKTNAEKVVQSKPDIMSMQQVNHDRPFLNTSYVEPENELQIRLVNIWSDILGVKGIGICDNFFELGGHSLMATQLIAIIKDEFLVELEMNELFDCSTVSELAEMITIKLSDLIEQMDEQEIDSYLGTEN